MQCKFSRRSLLVPSVCAWRPGVCGGCEGDWYVMLCEKKIWVQSSFVQTIAIITLVILMWFLGTDSQTLSVQLTANKTILGTNYTHEGTFQASCIYLFFFIFKFWKKSSMCHWIYKSSLTTNLDCCFICFNHVAIIISVKVWDWLWVLDPFVWVSQISREDTLAAAHAQWGHEP